MILNLIAFLAALLLALLLVPVFSQLARRAGLVDRPDKHRKLHGDEVPMVGGLVLMTVVPIAAFLVVLLGLAYSNFIADFSQRFLSWLPDRALLTTVELTSEDVREFAGLFIAAAVLFLVGAIDDRFNIRGRQKLVGQFIAVTILIIAGYQFEHFYIFGFRVDFGVLSWLIVYLWILAAINSVNLLDGADGIAGTIGLIMSLSVCAMALYLGKLVDAVIAAAIAGTLLGFLRYNFPPAKAYLGDAGSMLIGLLLSALSIRCMFKYSAAYAFLAPLALLAIPFIDTSAAIIRRRLTGRSIFAVDRGHLHHSLLKRGYSPRVSLLWVAMLTSTTAAGAVLSLVYRHAEFAVLSIVLVLFVMITCRIFGLAEYQLVTRRAQHFASTFFRLGSPLPDFMQGSVHVQGNRNWKEVWRLLYQFAEENQLSKLTLDINAPWLHESFHATRNLTDQKKQVESREWHVVLPLVIQEKACGRVEIQGTVITPTSHHDIVRSLMTVLSDIEFSLSEIGIHQTPDKLDSLEQDDEKSEPIGQA